MPKMSLLSRVALQACIPDLLSADSDHVVTSKNLSGV
jgi:hypothetical protein